MKLKIFVDVKSQKVVFAEAGKDFVDFILSLMHLPLLSVTKILKDKNGMVGCFGALYESIQSLNSQQCDNDLALRPRFPPVVTLLSLKESTTKFTFYKCHKCDYATDLQTVYNICCCSPGCRGILSELASIELDKQKAEKYMKESGPYIVTDKLEVKPMSISLVKSLWDVDCLEEREVEFGNQEGLALLKASLENEAALTTVFLGQKV